LYAFWGYLPFHKYSVLGLAFLFTHLIFLYFKAKGYYAMGLYPIYLGFGSVYCEAILAENGKKYLRWTLPALSILTFLPLIELIFPVYKPDEMQKNKEIMQKIGLLRWEDGEDHNLPQDFADMLSWKELAEKVDVQLAQCAPNTLVICDNYGQAGAINFYSKHKNIRAVSFNADYINWFPLEKPIQDVIMIRDKDDEDVHREDEKPLFEHIFLADSLTNPYAREFGSRIFVLKKARVDINERLRREIKEESPF
jgi:hypothetical protein